MNFKTYNPEEEDYLDEGFHSVLQRPEDVEKYRNVIAQALEDAEDILGMSSEVEILFGLTDTEKVQGRWGQDLTANFYSNGFTFGSWFEGIDHDFIFLRANDYHNDWEAALKNMAVHERAHIEFYDHHSDEDLAERLNGSVYNSVLFEGHSMNTAAKLNEEKDYGWSPEFRQLSEVSPDYAKLKQELEKDRTDSEFFDKGGEEWQEGEGYIIAYEGLNWVLEKKDIGLDDLPALSEEDAVELIDEAAEQLYS